MLAASASSSIRPSSSKGVVSAGIGPDQVTLFLSIWAPLGGRSLAAFHTAYNSSQSAKLDRRASSHRSRRFAPWQDGGRPLLALFWLASFGAKSAAAREA